MPESIPVAVIGVGHMGRHHARLYSEMPEAELVAVVDRRLDRAQEVAAQFRTAALPSLDELPARIAAASVAVPTSAHRAVAEALLARGVAVLVEKPLALTMEDGRRLVAFADRSGVLLSVGHTERFNPVVRALRRLEIEPRFIETDRISPFSFRSADIGVVADMMIHDLDVLLHLMERGAERRRPIVTRVDAVGVSVLGPHEDVVNARIEFENGTVANMTASRLALKTERKLRVISEQAYLSVDYQAKTGIAVVKDANLDILQLAAERKLDDLSEMKAEDFGKMLKVEPLQVDDVDPLRAELQAFLDSVRHGTRPAVSAADGLAAMELGERIVASVKAHRWDGASATIR